MRAALISIAATALLGSPVTGQTLDAELVRSLEEEIAREMASQAVVGLTVAIGLDGELAWTKGFGLADLEHDVPATDETVYRLASISKPVTAAAVMQLAEQGTIDLDAPIDTYVDAWPDKRWPVTTRQVLAHLGGVRHYLPTDVQLNTKAYETATESLEYFAADPLIAEPGTRYSYSSYGYNMLGAVVEGASGMTFVDYLNEHVFPAAGTECLQDDSQSRIIPHRSEGYRRVDGEVRNAMLVDISYKVGGGGLCATAADLVRFAHAMHAGDIVAPETCDEMWTRQRTKSGDEIQYGLGWFVDEDSAGRKIVRHGGSQSGARTTLLYFVGDGVAVSVMCNSEWCNPPRIAMPVMQRLIQSRR